VMTGVRKRRRRSYDHNDDDVVSSMLDVDE
jgi:hypothetical protein